MLIRIRNTTFGLVVNGIVKPKSPKDPPFDVDEKLGLRLRGGSVRYRERRGTVRK